jgi:hypothetical protein
VPNAKDNCPDDANADQADEDGDGKGDACDEAAPPPPDAPPSVDPPGEPPVDDCASGGCGDPTTSAPAETADLGGGNATAADESASAGGCAMGRSSASMQSAIGLLVIASILVRRRATVVRCVRGSR